jgi:hypothetical protein
LFLLLLRFYSPSLIPFGALVPFVFIGDSDIKEGWKANQKSYWDHKQVQCTAKYECQ